MNCGDTILVFASRRPRLGGQDEARSAPCLRRTRRAMECGVPRNSHVQEYAGAAYSVESVDGLLVLFIRTISPQVCDPLLMVS